MTLNPIKVVNFKGFAQSNSSNIKVKVNVNTEHCNLNSGTWQVCLKDFSYLSGCPSDKKSEAEGVFIDFKTNLLTFLDGDYCSFYTHLARIAYKGYGADTVKLDQVWYNVAWPTQEPAIILTTHNLSSEKKLKHNFQFQVTALFRRVL